MIDFFWLFIPFFVLIENYFLTNLGDWFFLVVYPFFGFNWALFFNKSIYVNLYKLIFFYFLLFPLLTKQKWGNLKFFLSSQLFSPRIYQKAFSSKWTEKLDIIFWQKYLCTVAHGLVHVAFLIFFLFFFFSFIWTWPLLPLFYLFIYMFIYLFTGQASCTSIFFPFFFLFSFVFFFVFLFLFRCDFFSRHDFYFLINLGDWFFFGCLSIFWF